MSLPNIPWFVYVMLLAPVGLVVVAAVYKYLQVRAASDWPSVQGKVIVSKSEVRKVKILDDSREDGHRFEERNFANIIYEYSIAGQKYQNNRVSIGEDLGNFQVAETIARYPSGMMVTVYYNPSKRNEAVLERDMPKGMWGCIGILVAIVVGGVFISAVGFKGLSDFISAKLAHSEMSGMVAALGGFGAAVALFALMFHRQAAAAKKWPVVQGQIKTSEIEEFMSKPEEDRTHGVPMFRSKVSYAYRFNNIAYVGLGSDFGAQVTSTSRKAAETFTAKYPVGKTIDVHVNPENPSQAVLETRTVGVWILWIVAAAMWGLAAYIAIKG